MMVLAIIEMLWYEKVPSSAGQSSLWMQRACVYLWIGRSVCSASLSDQLLTCCVHGRYICLWISLWWEHYCFIMWILNFSHSLCCLWNIYFLCSVAYFSGTWMPLNGMDLSHFASYTRLVRTGLPCYDVNDWYQKSGDIMSYIWWNWKYKILNPSILLLITCDYPSLWGNFARCISQLLLFSLVFVMNFLIVSGWECHYRTELQRCNPWITSYKVSLWFQ